MLRNLYLAYAVTWVILGIYFVLLGRRHQRLKAEQAALRK
jgi:CcmD family protein